jgi:hypothetical protein
MSGRSNNLQYDQSSAAKYLPRDMFISPEPGVNPLWIFLAFIIVGTMIYFGYMYMMENKADADAARKQQEMREYIILARQASTLPQ